MGLTLFIALFVLFVVLTAGSVETKIWLHNIGVDTLKLGQIAETQSAGCE